MNALTAGRPPERRVTVALYEAALAELSDKGFEKATIAAIASRARTSKQAIYRRFPDKVTLIAAAVDHGFQMQNLEPPLRLSVAEDLRQTLIATVEALQNTSLCGAIRALVSCRAYPPIAELLDTIENDRRLLLRQIFIATSFETDMEIRIDLLMGLIYFRLLIRNTSIGPDDIERAIYLVLGLVAPRDPAANPRLPGI